MTIKLKYESTERLAKLLAEENFSVNFDSSLSTASFNPVDRILTFPVFEKLNKAILDGFACHEIGHAKFTPAINPDEVCQTHKLNFGILNIVEDARIEQSVKLQYPGSRKMFADMYKELTALDFFKLSGKVVNDMSFPDRINLHYKVGPMLNIKFNDDELSILDDMADMGTTVNDFSDAIEIVKKIQKLIKEQKNEDKSPETDGDQPQPNDESSSSSPDYSNESETQSGGSSNEQDEQDEDNTETDSSADSSDESDETDEEPSQSPSGEEVDIDEEAGKPSTETADATPPGEQSQEETDSNEYDPANDDSLAETDKALAENFKTEASSTYNNRVDNIELDAFSLKELIDANIVIPFNAYEEKCNASRVKPQSEYFNTSYAKDLKLVKKLASSLSNQFNMKKAASVSSRTRTAKTGTLDINKLFSASYNDDVFCTNEIVQDGKNHGIVLFLDWSGSMSNGKKDNVLRQTVAMTTFCKNAGIPFKVYVFTSWCMSLRDDVKRSTNPTIAKLQSNGTQLVEISNSEINKARYDLGMTRAYSDCYLSMSQTPLNDCIIAAAPILNDFKTRFQLDKISLTILTDGASHNALLRTDNDYTRSSINVKTPNRKSIVYDHCGGYGFGLTDLSALILKTQVPGLVLNLYGLVNRPDDVVGIGLVSRDIKRTAPEEYKKIRLALNSSETTGIVELDNIWHGFDKVFLVSNKKSSITKIDMLAGIDSTTSQKDRIKSAKKNLSASTSLSKINKAFASTFIDVIS